MSDQEAALIALFWTIGSVAIGYGLAVWTYGRRARRRERTAKEALHQQMVLTLLQDRDG